MKNKLKNGFTLFELLVSISIIGIMTALAIVSYGSAQKKARDSRRIQDLNAIQKAAEQYYSMNNAAYPLSGLWVTGQTWTVSGTTILESFPKDPKNSAPYVYTANNFLLPPNNATGYCFCTQLENAIGNASDAGCTFTGVNGDGAYYCIKNVQ